MGGIEFELGDKSFVAVEQTGPKGNPMWRYPEIDDEEHREIEPLASDLPESILIAGRKHQFGEVRTRNGGTRPFTKARELRADTEVAGAPANIHCRVTKRRNGKWYFWLKIDPSGKQKKEAEKLEGRDRSSTSDDPSSALEKLESVFPAK